MTRTVMREKLSATPEGKVLLGVIDAAGGPHKLAEEIGVKPQTVDNWVYLSMRVSREGAIAIEQAFDGVTKESLRPDVTDWDRESRKRDIVAELQKTPRGQGLLMVLERVKFSRKALCTMLGLSTPSLVKNWIDRGYIPKHHVRRLVELPEFAGLTAEMIRPDLHELDY